MAKMHTNQKAYDDAVAIAVSVFQGRATSEQAGELISDFLKTVYEQLKELNEDSCRKFIINESSEGDQVEYL